MAYDAAWDYFVTQEQWHPDSTPGKAKRPRSSGSAFDELAWFPDGEVRGSYDTFDFATGCDIGFSIAAVCDVDGYGYDFCQDTGVITEYEGVVTSALGGSMTSGFAPTGGGASVY